MTIRTITGTVEYADGAIPQNSRLEFYLNGIHIDAVTIAHSAVYTPLDETGDIVVDLYPNDVGYGADRYNVDLVTYSDSEYIREIRRVNLGKIYVEDVDGQILQDLLALFSGPAGELSVAEQAAQDAIDAAVDAESAASTAAGYAGIQNLLATGVAAMTIPATVAVFRTVGYSVAGDFGGAEYKRVASEPTHEGKLEDASGAWFELKESLPLPQMFGAKADNNGTPGNGTDDTTAITNWLQYVLTVSYTGMLRGKYRYRPTVDWDFGASNQGILIRGENRNEDGFILDAGYQLNLSSANFFYLGIDRVKVEGDVAGHVVRIGKDDFSDAFNCCDFDMVINNRSLHADAEGLRVNYVLMSKFFVTANCGGTGRPGQPTTPGNGKAIHLRQACFNTFQVAGGNANVGMLLSTGYIYSNTFQAIDFEEVAVAVRCTSANATKNAFVSGQILGTTSLDFTAGYANVFEAGCNIANYAGGSMGTNLVGVEIRATAQQTYVVPPAVYAVPSSGTYQKNTTGYKCLVNIWAGNVSNVALKAPDTGSVSINPQVVGETVAIIVPPNWEVAITYSSAPLWLWLPA